MSVRIISYYSSIKPNYMMNTKIFFKNTMIIINFEIRISLLNTLPGRNDQSVYFERRLLCARRTVNEKTPSNNASVRNTNVGSLTPIEPTGFSVRTSTGTVREDALVITTRQPYTTPKRNESSSTNLSNSSPVCGSRPRWSAAL